MSDDNRARNGTLGAILGALIAVAFAIFLLSGGEHVGKKTVNSDADLPPIAAGAPRARPPRAYLVSGNSLPSLVKCFNHAPQGCRNCARAHSPQEPRSGTGVGLSPNDRS